MYIDASSSSFLIHIRRHLTLLVANNLNPYFFAVLFVVAGEADEEGREGGLANKKDRISNMYCERINIQIFALIWSILTMMQAHQLQYRNWDATETEYVAVNCVYPFLYASVVIIYD